MLLMTFCTLAVPNQTQKADESEHRPTTANKGHHNSSRILGSSRRDTSRAPGMFFIYMLYFIHTNNNIYHYLRYNKLLAAIVNCVVIVL